jgi:hypothetical protein
VYLWVTVRLRLPGACSSCSRAGAVDAGEPSTLGDEGGLFEGGRLGTVQMGRPYLCSASFLCLKFPASNFSTCQASCVGLPVRGQGVEGEVVGGDGVDGEVSVWERGMMWIFVFDREYDSTLTWEM